MTPCLAPSYARACLSGDPSMSPLRIERQARAEHLWQRTFTTPASGGFAVSDHFDILFPAFTSSGGACLKSVTMIVTVTPEVGAPVVTAVPVTIVGIAGVWDFTDSTPDWTTRVAIPCEEETLDIITTTGRCPCNVVCEGCLYPAGVGGLFMVRYKYAPQAFGGDPDTTTTITFTAGGTHTPTAPCCTMPVHVSEEVVVAGPYPAIQDSGL